MAKTKKTSAKTSVKKQTSKTVVKPLDAPRIKLPEDDLAPVPPPTLTSILRAKLARVGKFLSRNRVKALFLLIIAVGIGWGVSNYLETRNQLNQLADPKTSSQTEINIITERVKDVVDLPTGETPIVATVTDVEKRKSQPFFRNAQDGDKVLIYSKAGRALLYRYSTKKVIEYSSVSLNGQQQTGQDQTQNQTQQQSSQNQNNTQTPPANTQPTTTPAPATPTQ